MASACRMPTEADDDWMTAVNSAPTAMPSSGLEKRVISPTNASLSRSGVSAEDIMFMPMNSRPSPVTMPQTLWMRRLLMNRHGATPANASSGASAPMSSATSWPVIVVPMLAPMMTPTAPPSVISPALTNPTTMTVVADED